MPLTRRSIIFSGLALALRRQKVDEAVKLIQAKVDSGDVRAASLHVRCGKDVFQQGFGAAKSPRSVFLLASISKPMTASAVMLLSDRGKLSIDDPVQKFIPEFKGSEKDRILIRHLLTHTSGLPDMLPENDDLRKRHAPLKDFVAATCKTALLFSPGTKVKYQSMGILVAAEIVQRVADRTLPDFLRDEIYPRWACATLPWISAAAPSRTRCSARWNQRGTTGTVLTGATSGRHGVGRTPRPPTLRASSSISCAPLRRSSNPPPRRP